MQKLEWKPNKKLQSVQEREREMWGYIMEIREYVGQNFVTKQISRKRYSKSNSQTSIKIMKIECTNKWDSEMVSEWDNMKWSECEHWVGL